MVKISIKKFSRSKVEEPITEEETNVITPIIEDTEQEPIITKSKKGRPKKQKQEPITPIEVLQEEPEKEYISEPEQEPEQTEDTFLDDLNNVNFIEEVKPTKQELKESEALLNEIIKPKKSKPQKMEKLTDTDIEKTTETETDIETWTCEYYEHELGWLWVKSKTVEKRDRDDEAVWSILLGFTLSLPFKN